MNDRRFPRRRPRSRGEGCRCHTFRLRPQHPRLVAFPSSSRVCCESGAKPPHRSTRRSDRGRRGVYRPVEEQFPAGIWLPVFSMQGAALVEPLAGGLLVVAHPQTRRVAISTPAAHVRVIMSNPPTEIWKKRRFYSTFARISKDVTKTGAARTVDKSRRTARPFHGRRRIQVV